MGKNVTLNNSTLVILSETFRQFTRKLISQRYRFIMTGIFTFNQDVNNIYSSYFKRESSDYRDVTLVSQEGDFFEAHKLVLSAWSEFFNQVLNKTKPGNNPIIYLHGIDTFRRLLTMSTLEVSLFLRA